jgi:hypothetical protein
VETDSDRLKKMQTKVVELKKKLQKKQTIREYLEDIPKSCYKLGAVVRFLNNCKKKYKKYKSFDVYGSQNYDGSSGIRIYGLRFETEKEYTQRTGKTKYQRQKDALADRKMEKEKLRELMIKYPEGV